MMLWNIDGVGVKAKCVFIDLAKQIGGSGVKYDSNDTTYLGIALGTSSISNLKDERNKMNPMSSNVFCLHLETP